MPDSKVKLSDWIDFLKFSVKFGRLPDNGTWQFENMLTSNKPPYNLQAVLVPNKENFKQWQQKIPLAQPRGTEASAGKAPKNM